MFNYRYFQILTTVAEGPRGLGEIYAGRVVSGIGIGAISTGLCIGMRTKGSAG